MTTTETPQQTIEIECSSTEGEDARASFLAAAGKLRLAALGDPKAIRSPGDCERGRIAYRLFCSLQSLDEIFELLEEIHRSEKITAACYDELRRMTVQAVALLDKGAVAEKPTSNMQLLEIGLHVYAQDPGRKLKDTEKFANGYREWHLDYVGDGHLRQGKWPSVSSIRTVIRKILREEKALARPV